MAVGKVTTFKVDEKTMELISDIGTMTGAKNGHRALRDGVRLGWAVLHYKRTEKLHKGALSLEEYLLLVGSL